MGIETTALTDLAGLADPSATPAARPGNPDFAPFLTLATVTAAPASLMVQPGQPLDEAMHMTLPTPLSNVAVPAQPSVGKPTSADPEPQLSATDAGQAEDAMLQSAYDIVQQLASTTVAPGEAPTKPAVPDLPPAVAVAPKPQPDDQPAADSDGDDGDDDDIETASLPIQPLIAPPPATILQPATLAAAAVQERPEPDATPLPPKTGGRPVTRPAVPAQLPLAMATTEARIDQPSAPVDAPLADPVAMPAHAGGQAENKPSPPPVVPIAVAKGADAPVKDKVDLSEPVTPSQTAAAPATARHDVAAPASAPVSTHQADAASAAPAATPVGAAIARALDDLVIAGANDDQWVHRLASDIQTLTNGDVREAKLQLRPQELGGMAIKLEMEDRHTRVHFTVESAAARELIADAAPRLQHLVEARGLKLDQATVEVAPPSESSAGNNNGNGNGNGSSSSANGSSAGTGSGSGRQGQQGHEPQNFRAPRDTAEARAAARALTSGKFERFA